MTDKDWWKPEKLAKIQRKLIDKRSTSPVINKGDFYSYEVMLRTNDIVKSDIMSHNEIYPNYRVTTIKKILGDFSPMTIVDIGCGLGFTTDKFRSVYPKANLLGIDISKDAIDYASLHFPLCDFLSQSINPKISKQKISGDLIFACEFYPFTRTDSYGEHKAYITHLTKHLNPNGKLLIFQNWDNKTSLSKTFEHLVKDLSFLTFKTYTIPIRKIGTIVPNRTLANMISAFIRLFFKICWKKNIGRHKIIIVEKLLTSR